MAVVIDDLPLQAEALGLATLGDLLSHVRRGNRLVVNLLIDGCEPDLAHIRTLRGSPLAGRVIYVETSDPADMARQALDSIQRQLFEAQRLSATAVELLRSNQIRRALEQLGGCFSVWHNAQDAVQKVSQLLRLDLSRAPAGGRSLQDLLTTLADQLRSLKQALENRDYVALIDGLEYEARPTIEQYAAAIAELKSTLTPTRRAA
jgi:hypothetical protein